MYFEAVFGGWYREDTLCFVRWESQVKKEQHVVLHPDITYNNLMYSMIALSNGLKCKLIQEITWMKLIILNVVTTMYILTIKTLAQLDHSSTPNLIDISTRADADMTIVPPVAPVFLCRGCVVIVRSMIDS